MTLSETHRPLAPAPHCGEGGEKPGARRRWERRAVAVTARGRAGQVEELKGASLELLHLPSYLPVLTGHISARTGGGAQGTVDARRVDGGGEQRDHQRGARARPRGLAGRDARPRGQAGALRAPRPAPRASSLGRVGGRRRSYGRAPAVRQVAQAARDRRDAELQLQADAATARSNDFLTHRAEKVGPACLHDPWSVCASDLYGAG